MGRLSRAKGSAFERLVAQLVREALATSTFPLTRSDCYRTPLSGGHPYADRGDLVISPRLRERFPFTVECKHHRNWTAAQLLRPTAQVWAWVEQAQSAARSVGRPYLLVMRGNGTPIYALWGAPGRGDWWRRLDRQASLLRLSQAGVVKTFRVMELQSMLAAIATFWSKQ